jgi:hypothetical protein
VHLKPTNAMLWNIPYSTNSNVIPGISVCIGHAIKTYIKDSNTTKGNQNNSNTKVDM